MLRKLGVLTALTVLSLSSAALAHGRERDFNDGYYRHEYYEGRGNGQGNHWRCPPHQNYGRQGYYTESYTTWEPSYSRVYNYPQPVYNYYPQPRVIYQAPRPNVVFQLGF